MNINKLDAAKLSDWVYSKDLIKPSDIIGISDPEKWKTLRINSTDSPLFISSSGYAGAGVIKEITDTNGNLINLEVVIVHRGTKASITDWSDLKADLNLIRYQNPQLSSAEEFYNLVKQKIAQNYPELDSSKIKITQTGHSLGGNLAQLLAIENNEDAITFNAAGVGHLISAEDYQKYMNNSDYKDKIKNYINPDDIVASFFPQVGEVHYVNIPDQTSDSNWLKWMSPGTYAFDSAVDKLSAIRYEHSISNFVNGFSEINTIPTNCTYTNLKNVRQDILNGTSPYTDVVEILDDIHDTPSTIKNISFTGAKAVINLTKDRINYIITKTANTVNVIKETFQQEYNQAEIYLNNQTIQFEKKSNESLEINAEKKQGSDLLDLFLNKEEEIPAWMQNISLRTPENIYQVKTKKELTNFIQQEFQDLYLLEDILKFETNFGLSSDDQVKENFILLKPGEDLKTPFKPETVKVYGYQKMVLSANETSIIIDQDTYYTDGSYAYFYQGGENDLIYLLAIPRFFKQDSPEDGFYPDVPFDSDHTFEWVNGETYIDYNAIYNEGWGGELPEDNWTTLYKYYTISFNDNTIQYEKKNILISPEIDDKFNRSYKISGTDNDDQLMGRNTDNEFSGGYGKDLFIINSVSRTDKILDFNNTDDKILLKNDTGNPWQIEVLNQGENTILMVLESDKKIIAEGVCPNQLNKNNFIFVSNKMNEKESSINMIPFFNSSGLGISSIVTNEDTSVLLDVLSQVSDLDGDALTISAVIQGSSCTTAIENDKIKLTPNANFNGEDSFTYTISDRNGGIIAQTVTVTINPINDSPIATLTTGTINEDDSLALDVLAKSSDVDGDNLTITGITQGINGKLIIENNKLKYTPNANFNGQDSFTYTISDGNGGTDTKTVTLTINAVNDAPTANLISATTNEDTNITIDVLSSAQDMDGDDLSISTVTQGTNGTVIIENKKITYSPNANFNGEDTFAYTISDNKGGTTSETMTVTVTPINDAPTTTLLPTATIEENKNLTIDVLSQASDIDQDQLTISNITQGQHGKSEIKDNAILYTPNTDFSGNDTFTYTISDGNGGTTTQNVTIEVTPNPTQNPSPTSSPIQPQTPDQNQTPTQQPEMTAPIISDQNTQFLMLQNLGKTTINDNGGEDVIKFDSSIKKDQITFIRNGEDLNIDYGNGDSVTIKNQWQTENKIEKFQVSDGGYLTANDINQVIDKMTSFAATQDFSINSTEDIKQNQDLMAMMSAAWHV